MDLILHVGHGKTGTTSIQRFLHDNQKTLGEYGVAYPSDRPKFFAELTGRRGNGQAGQEDSDSAGVIQHINRSIGDQPRPYLLLSSEMMWNLEPAQFREIIDAIDAEFDQVHIIVYLRPQQSLYLSMMQQRLRGHSAIIPPEKFSRRFLQPLQRFAEVAGEKNLHIRPFVRKALHEGDAIADFFQVLSEIIGSDIPYREFPVEPTTRNTSFRAEQMIAMRDFRKAFLAHIDGQHHPVSKAIWELFNMINSAPALKQTKPALRDEYKELIASNHLNDIQQVDQCFGTDFCDVFIPHHCDPGAARPAKELELEDILTGYDPTLVDKYKTIIPHFNRLEGASDVLKEFTQALGDEFVIVYCNFLRCSAEFLSREDLLRVPGLDQISRSPYQLLFFTYAQLRAGNREGARAFALASLEARCDAPFYFHKVFEILATLSELQAAETALGKAASMAPDVALFHLLLSHLYQGTGRGVQALAEAREAITLEETNASLYLHLGTLLNENEDFAAAIPVLKKGIALAPGLAPLRAQLTLAMDSQGH